MPHSAAELFHLQRRSATAGAFQKKKQKTPRSRDRGVFQSWEWGLATPSSPDTDIWRSAYGGWLSVPRRCSPRQAEFAVSQQDRPACHQAEVSGEASLPGSDATCRWRLAGHGSGASVNRRPISGMFPGRPPLLAGRWPGTTGLTSYPSGCVSFTVGRRRFRHRPSFGAFANFARLAFLPVARAPLRFPRATGGSSGGVVPPRRVRRAGSQ